SRQWWSCKVGSSGSEAPDSQPPAAPLHGEIKSKGKLHESFMGSFRPAAGNPCLHGSHNFAESLVETALSSLRHSCRSELTRQGTSLPKYCYSSLRRSPVLRFGPPLSPSPRLSPFWHCSGVSRYL